MDCFKRPKCLRCCVYPHQRKSLWAFSFEVYMAPDAYLKINRKMFDGLVESFPERLKKQVRILWWHLLWNANYMDNGKLKRGQIYASRQSLGDATMLSDRTIRTLLNRLKSDQPNANRFLKATNQTTNSATILTIVNYDGWVLAKDKCPTETRKRPTKCPYKNRSKRNKRRKVHGFQRRCRCRI